MRRRTKRVLPLKRARQVAQGSGMKKKFCATVGYPIPCIAEMTDSEALTRVKIVEE